VFEDQWLMLTTIDLTRPQVPRPTWLSSIVTSRRTICFTALKFVRSKWSWSNIFGSPCCYSSTKTCQERAKGGKKADASDRPPPFKRTLKRC